MFARAWHSKLSGNAFTVCHGIITSVGVAWLRSPKRKAKSSKTVDWMPLGGQEGTVERTKDLG